jgi:hypothetical protein
MTRDRERQGRMALATGSGRRRRRVAAGVSFEPLESRRLPATAVAPVTDPPTYQSVLAQEQQALQANAQAAKSRPDPPAGHSLPKSQRVRFGNSFYTIALSGSGGVVAQSVGHRGVKLTLMGTDQNSKVTVTLSKMTHASQSAFLPITRIDVPTGALGSFQALNTADLTGAISPLNGTVGSLQFYAIDANAAIVINGSLGSLSVAQNVNLGATGQIHVTGDVTGPVSIGGGVSLAGGQIHLDRDLTNTLSVTGDLALSNGGRLAVGRDLNPLLVGGNVVASSNGVLDAKIARTSSSDWTCSISPSVAASRTRGACKASTSTSARTSSRSTSPTASSTAWSRPA